MLCSRTSFQHSRPQYSLLVGLLRSWTCALGSSPVKAVKASCNLSGPFAGLGFRSRARTLTMLLHR